MRRTELVGAEAARPARFRWSDWPVKLGLVALL
ncbi:MAG: hypothetical protein HW378_1962, partial [Anaerolineales bacterium]|nr:hypothetical protein [Anaerolineales bacterium]